MALNPADPHDLRLVVVEVAQNSPNLGEFFAVSENNASGIPIPTFRTGTALPAAGSMAGEGFFVTTSRRGYVWDGASWHDVTPSPILSYATDAALLADTGKQPGVYATTQDTGNLYMTVAAGWKQLNTRQYATVADMVAEIPPMQTIAEVTADGSLWEYRDPGGAGAQWVCTTVREFPDLAGVQGWTTATQVGDRALAQDTDVQYVRVTGGWKPISIWEDTEAHIRADTTSLNGQQALATDTNNFFIRKAGQWVEDPIQHFASDFLLQASTPPDGTLAWADDSGRVYARSGGAWIGMNTTFSDPIPIGAIAAFPSRSIPVGWLECDGSAVPADAKYNDLRGVLGAGNPLPDLRGEFLRGAKAGETILQHNQWTTARPRTPFSTDITGVHDHQAAMQQKTVGWTSGSPFKVMANNTHDPENSNAGPVRTDRQGGHQHGIDGGGDAETAPDHTLIVYCIKAHHNTLAPSALSMQYYGTNEQDGEVLTYSGSQQAWINQPPVAGGFHPTITTPVDGDYLKYDAATTHWINAALPFDPVITTPADGEFLKYDAANTQWVNAALPQGLQVQSLTQAAYDALGTKDPNTLYLITGP